MGFRLVIAEKPSVSAAIAKVIGAGERKDGYFQGSRDGLIRELAGMKVQLAPEEKRLAKLTDRVIGKLKDMDDETFEGLDFYPD